MCKQMLSLCNESHINYTYIGWSRHYYYGEVGFNYFIKNITMKTLYNV